MPAFVSLLSSFDLLPWVERVSGKPAEGFYCHVSIGGADFHAIALPVQNITGEQTALSDENVQELEDLFRMLEPGSPFETSKVKDYDCVIHITPFAE
ncbi:MAG: hypothetical protein EPN91_08715 [Salinibacterium sp.]|nr:MAG: hypothetical protein EPN91_08715 [Salinibacterium sp.]